jgi:DnaJ like chaperone protein
VSWIGKVVGGAFGFVMGGPIGAALGAALGHQLDERGLDPFRLDGAGSDPEEAQRLQMAFFGATFQVMGHIAKADGRISESEIEAARIIMDRMMLPDHLRKSAMRLFNEGKRAGFPLDAVVDQFLTECRGRPQLVRRFIVLQTEAALAEGPLQTAEEALLLRLCDRLHFSRYEFFGIRTRLEAEQRFSGFGPGAQQHQYQRRRQHESHYQQWRRHEPPRPRETPLSEAYVTLGLTSSATDSDVKRAYRKLISQHHPDKLSAQKVTPERMQKATEQTQKIQKAYDAICKARQI